MTTPWVEAGGNGTISCAKTGFNTDIEFFTKSIFSSERNKIKAKMSGPKTASAKDATIYEGKSLAIHYLIITNHISIMCYPEGLFKPLLPHRTLGPTDFQNIGT